MLVSEIDSLYLAQTSACLNRQFRYSCWLSRCSRPTEYVWPGPDFVCLSDQRIFLLYFFLLFSCVCALVLINNSRSARSKKQTDCLYMRSLSVDEFALCYRTANFQSTYKYWEYQGTIFYALFMFINFTCVGCWRCWQFAINSTRPASVIFFSLLIK